MSSFSSLSEFGSLELLDQSFVTLYASSNISIDNLLVDDNSHLNIEGEMYVDNNIYINKNATVTLSNTGKIISNGDLHFSNTSQLIFKNFSNDAIVIDGHVYLGGRLDIETQFPLSNNVTFLRYQTSSYSFSSVAVNGNEDDYEVVYGLNEASIRRIPETSTSDNTGTTTQSDQNISGELLSCFFLLCIAVFLA
eukprot:TRINITY_DN7062_c0_g1_i1.p1 TRINITY_DN7062_c0_g1~~TRINITY_DN7062_c0_g1_i1.p1  ORF type:complete len:194 (-),score=37.00 TRINITY_DN7062_c0_g1_i1:98-679(-)